MDPIKTAPRMELTRMDRLIAEVAPKYAMRRVHTRWAMGEMMGHVRAYEAAKLGRRTDGWIATGTSANAEIGPQLARLRNRSRELVRNNPFAAKAVRVLASKIIGKGITPRCAGKDTNGEEIAVDVRQCAKDDWARFSDHCDPDGLLDFYGLQKLAVRSTVESGGALLQLLPRPSHFNLHVPLQVRVLEADYIDMGKTCDVKGGGVVIQGVEYDTFGRRVAYWLFDQHPGDGFTSIGRRYNSVRVDARYILPVMDIIRPGQVHGVPWMAPAAMKFRDVGDLEEARIVKKKIEACFVAFVTRTGDGAGSPLGATPTTDTKGRRIESMSPGLIQHLEPGENVEFGKPSGSEGDADFLILQLHGIAAGTGCTYSQLTGDTRGSNFASFKTANIDIWGFVDDWQQFMAIPQMCRPVWREVDNLLVAMGKRRMPHPRAVWTSPERPLVDPARDGKAIDQSIRAGRLSLPAAIQATGRDPEEVLAEIDAANKLLDSYGLILDTDPRRTAAAGTAQAAIAAIIDEKEDDNANP